MRGEKRIYCAARVCGNAGAHGVRAGLLSNRFRSELAQMHAIVSFLVAVTFVCMPGMAYATDAGDGFSGSEGGSFNIGQIWDAASSDWSSFDWYIGSVYDQLFGGGGGHAFSGGTDTGSGDAGTGSGGTGATTGNPATTSSTFTVTLTNYVLDCATSSACTTVNDVSYRLWRHLEDNTSYPVVQSNYPSGNRLTINLSGVDPSVYKYYFVYLSPYSGTNFKLVVYVSDTQLSVSKSDKKITVACQGNTKYLYNTDCNLAISSMPFDATYNVWPNSTASSGTTRELSAGCLYATSGTVGGDGSSTGGDGSSTGGDSSSTGGDGSSTGDDYTYPSDDEWPEPSVPTLPDVGNPTVGEVTETTVDLSPVTNRQDIANTLLYAISSNDAALYNMLVAEFDQFEREVYDLGDFLGRYLYLVSTGIKTLHDDLGEIETALGTLDHDTDAIDLTGINSKLDQLISALGNQTAYDDDGVITAITGSHGSDLLGLYGRLDDVSTWLDAYTGFDDTNLRTTVENAAYDDTGLLSAITGSHGSDLLGLFGRLDLITNWLDAYTGYDDSGLMALLQDVYGALHNLQDGDSGFNTLRGDVRAILNDIDNLLAVLEGWPDYPNTEQIEARLDGILSALSGQYLGSNLSIWDWSRLIYEEIVALHNDFLDYWVEFRTFVTAWEDWAAQVLLRLGRGSDSNPVHYPVEVQDPDSGINYWIVPQGPSGIVPTDVLEPTLELHINVPFDGVWMQEAGEKLIQKFPFSALPKIAEVYGYIRRPAQAPVFQLPMPNPSDWSSPHMITVDLSQFDVVAAVLRMGLLIWWISKVANRTVKMWTGDK